MTLIVGDCEQALKDVPDRSVALIITSPPYADMRKSSYGGVRPEQYVSWFLPKAEQFKRVLRQTGSFVLNIKERVEKGERSPYVMELVMALRDQGWLWTEDWIWCKKTAAPGRWPNRFRDSWEHIHQFNLTRKFAMFQDVVMIPIGAWAKTRLKKLSKEDRRRHQSATGSGIGRKVANWTTRPLVYPTNVLHLATECGNKDHPAAFPVGLPEFFIKLFTQPGELVCDPFLGSGTSGVAAARLGRAFLGIDPVGKYVELSRQRIAKEGQSAGPIGEDGPCPDCRKDEEA